ncbi:MAG: hypothetical protein P4L75_05435 [Clostridia bacterium]|nr:hypothetical protein [Clostridia bacterium]
MLVDAMVGLDTRATMDMDATIRGIPVSDDAIAKAIQTILDCPVDDGVVMRLQGLEHIHEEAEYAGIRASIEAVLNKTHQVMKIDITTGDQMCGQVGRRKLKTRWGISLIANEEEILYA